MRGVRAVVAPLLAAVSACSRPASTAVPAKSTPSIAAEASPSRAPTPTSVASSTATAATSPAKGPLLWEAVLDPTGSDLDLASRYVVGDPDAASIRAIAGGVEVAILRRGGPAGVTFKQGLPARFVGEMEFRVVPGSDIQFVWRVRSGDQLHLLKVDTAREVLELVFSDPRDRPSRLQPLGPPMAIGALLSGRVISMAILAEAPRYAVYVDGRRVAEIEDARLTPEAGPFAIGAFGEQGQAVVVGLRAHALPLSR